ncbi:MAG: hypothetical protein LCH63_10310 [Candidatus Melainabacteria bacterium]|nr:hypothetical protein [Candidatus Melainabacteria bacterium]
MTANISQNYIQDAGRTNAQLKTTFEQMLDLLNEMLGGQGFKTATINISSNNLALTDLYSCFTIDSEDSSPDNLDSISSAGVIRDGQVYFLKIANAARPITVRNGQVGTKEIYTRTGLSRVLRSTSEIFVVQYREVDDAFFEILPDYTPPLMRVPGFSEIQTLAPASNVVTPTNGFILIDCASSTDINQIARTNFPDNSGLLIVGTADVVNVATLKHGLGTAGKLIHNNGDDLVLDSATKFVVYYPSTDSGNLVWRELTRFGFDRIPPLGSALQVLRVNAGGTALEFASPSSSGGDGFGGNGSRSLPTSGSISGDYYHDGDWTATGALTIADGTRIFVKNCSTFNMGSYSHVVSTRANSGGKGRPTSGNNGQNIATGSGPGAAAVGGGAGVSVVAGPGGAGFGGRGGRGGSYSDHFMPGGAIYSPRQFFGGTGGNSGMHYSSTSNAAPDGGEAGGALYLEISLNPGGLCTLGNLNLNGGAGTNAPTTNYSGSAGASGGCFVARIRGEAILPASRTISVNGGAGGGVGSGGTANAAAGGGGAGVIDIEATTWTNSGTLQANGGGAGSGGSYTASAGESSTPRAVGTGVNPCSYW